MSRLLAILVSALCISACANTRDSAGSNTAPVAEAPSPQPVENLPAETSAATVLESLEPPPVEPTAIPVAVAGESPGDRICRREVRTGTHRAVRVCRTRAEIERIEIESKDTFKDLHREQTFSDQIDPTGRN
jgi:hypothetical protein